MTIYIFPSKTIPDLIPKFTVHTGVPFVIAMSKHMFCPYINESGQLGLRIQIYLLH